MDRDEVKLEHAQLDVIEMTLTETGHTEVLKKKELVLAARHRRSLINW